jgi:hypothetical protein
MIAIEERSRKESRNQTLQLAQIFATKFKVRHLLDVQEKLTRDLHLCFV